VAKNKLARWAELNTFRNVIQPQTGDVSGGDHHIKGHWNDEMFGNSNPVVLELGCGKGEYTTRLSAIFPMKNFIGIDIKGARMWRGAKTANESGTVNVAFLRTRIEFISSFFSENEVDQILITFPDPQPGKKNSNKRLTCPWFLNKYRIILKDNGIVHLKTDNADLFRYTRRIATYNGLEILFETVDLYSAGTAEKAALTGIFLKDEKAFYDNEISNSIFSIRTFYEKMFLEEGLKICYLAFRLKKDKTIRDEWERKC
jgi:tRNA (guanine-N7-)-methyltransferase